MPRIVCNQVSPALGKSKVMKAQNQTVGKVLCLLRREGGRGIFYIDIKPIHDSPKSRKPRCPFMGSSVN